MSTRQTKSALTASLCLILSAAPIHAQLTVAQTAALQAQKKLLTDAASAGIPLPATISVSDNVNIEAVILPSEISRRVFGRNVSQNYVVIEVNIANRSKDAALIVHSLFIDLSRWGFAAPLLANGVISSGPPRTTLYSANDISSQVASVEYRIVRGQLQDAQPWTARNSTMRAMKVLGTMGVAFAFPFSTDVVKGIGAWNGAVVPGFEVFFPDGMEGQLNRINDYGFRNNKIIPQQSSDIVVAFFPIDRFLTPALRRVFLKSPALFYNPLLMAMDHKTGRLLEPMLIKMFGSREQARRQMNSLVEDYARLDVTKIEGLKNNIAQAEENLRKSKQDETAGKDEAALNTARKARAKAEDELKNAQLEFSIFGMPVAKNPIFQLFNSLSLGNVHIVVSGAMTIDQLTVPAAIESTCFDKAGADFWAAPARRIAPYQDGFSPAELQRLSMLTNWVFLTLKSSMRQVQTS